jgi:predicted AAA+ superfamily ATPase
MVCLERLLRIALPPKQSAFLRGPRKTGKSTFLQTAFPDSLRYDLLQTDVMIELAKRPSLLREQLLAIPARRVEAPVIIDEVQKVPQLLDEVHHLIEDRGLRFILCGSSARKLRRGRTNLLGGRAWRYEMRPLASPELPALDLLRALNRGLVPAHYLGVEYRRSLDAYVRDCGVDAKTVKEYYQILVDTLLGTFVEPYQARQGRQVITKASKFYLFDVGVAGALTKRHLIEERGEAFGRALEHFVLMEILAHRSYRDLHYDVHFWRTKTGLEVAFILGRGEVAIEVKGANRLDPAAFRSLRAFADDHRPRRAIVVCNERSPRLHAGINVLPWREFLERLWQGAIVS